MLNRRLPALCIALVLVLCPFAVAVAQKQVDTAELDKEVKQLKSKLKQAEKDLQTMKRELAKKARTLQEANAKKPTDVNQTQFVIPKMSKPPVIDGIVNPDEWAGAIGVPLTTGIFGMMERPSSYFYIGWDDEHIYFGQRLPMRKGEVPLRLNREPEHDNVYCGETSLEVYIDRKSHGSHPSLCRWQFMGNAVGNRWDREDQYRIGQNFIGWDGDWRYKQQLTEGGKYWDAEIAIPRKTVYQEDPIAEGDTWWIGLATNLHRPWCFSGFYQWRIPATFRESTPEIRMYHPERSLAYRGVVYDMVIRNTTDKPFKAELVTRILDRPQKGTRPVLDEQVQPVELAPGEEKRFEVKMKAGEKVRDKASYHIAAIVRQGERSVYTWSYPVRYNHPGNTEGLDYTPDPSPFVLEAHYNPIVNYVRVVVDKYDHERAEEVAKAVFSVRRKGAGGELASGELTAFPYGKGQSKVPTPANLKPGTYEVTATLVDKAGKELARHTVEFDRLDHEKEFPWLGNTIGEEDVVSKLFEPLGSDGDAITAYKKRIHLDGAALPKAIRAAGVDLLRSPVAVRGRADGNAFVLRPTEAVPVAGLINPARVIYKGTARGGPLETEVTYNLEYDSTARVTLTLKPAGGKSAKLDNLQFVIPFRGEAATHYMANGLNMRLSNQAGFIPGKGKTGRVWDSTSVPYQDMTVGSFIPIVWVGNLSGGITWFADSDEGWWPSDKHPAIQIDRTEDGHVDLVLNLAGDAVELSGQRTITFGLNVNPVRALSEHRGSPTTFGYLVETGRWDPKKTNSKVFARRYPEDLELNRAYIDACHKYNEIYAPYTEMSWADVPPKEADYFREAWRTADMGGNLLKCDSSNDCLVWWTAKWMSDAGLDGYYFDNVFNRLNWNTELGAAYRLPDGRIQPGYDIWGMRQQIKRIRTLLEKRREVSRICIHNTRYQFAPIMGFADLAMGGEMATPTMGSPDFMTMYPRDFMDVMYNVPLWGYKLSHLYHYRPKTFVDEFGNYDHEAALKGHRTAQATMLVHGVEFFHSINYHPGMLPHFKMLKALPGGKLHFTPSWQADGLFKVVGDDPDVDVAVWRKPDVLLVVVANYSKRPKTARVWLDFPKLINMPDGMETREVYDFETMEFPGYITTENAPERFPRIGGLRGGHNIMKQPNTFRLKVAPRDYRVILVINQPLAKGAGF